MLPCALYLILAILVYYQTLASPGVISYRNDWDIPPLREQFITGLTTRLYSWNPQQIMGIIYSIGSDTYYWIFLTGLGLLGGGEFTSKFMVVFLTFLSGSGAYFFLRSLGLDKISSWLGGIFYTYTTYCLYQILGGVLNSIFSYAFSPIYAALLVRSFGVQSKRSAVLAGIALALAFTYIDYVVILPIISLALVLMWSRVHILLRVKQFGLSLGIAVSLHFFWILPLLSDLFARNIVLRRIGEASYSVVRLYYTNGVSSPVLNSLSLLPAQGQAILALSVIPPIIAFMALFFFPKNRIVVGFAVIGIFGVLLVSGTKILGSIYSSLLLNIPYFTIFTIPIRLSPLSTLSYTVLIAFTTSAILKKMSSNTFDIAIEVRANPRVSRISIKHLVSILIIGVLLGSVISTFYMPPQSLDIHTLQTYSFNAGEIPAYDYLKQTLGDFRVAEFPLLGNDQPMSLHLPGADPMGVYPPKPAVLFGGGPTGVTDAAALTRLVSMGSYQNFTDRLANLLSLLNVGYITYHNATYDTNYQVEYKLRINGDQETLLTNFLTNQDGLQQVFQSGNVTVYKNSDFLPHIFATTDLTLVVGNLATIVPLCSISQIVDPRDTAFVLSDQLSPTQIEQNAYLSDRIIMYNNNFADLVASLIPPNYKIDPGQYAGEAAAIAVYPYDRFGWVPVALEWWVKPLHPGSEGLGAITSLNANLSIPFRVENEGQFQVWARIYHDPSSGSLTFFIEDNFFAEHNATSPVDSGYRWASLGTVNLQSGSHTFNIENSNGTSAILQLIIAPTNIINQSYSEAEEIVARNPLILIEKPIPQKPPALYSFNASDIFFAQEGLVTVNVENYTFNNLNNTFILWAPFGKDGRTNEAIVAHLNFAEPIQVSKGATLSLTYRIDDSSSQLLYPKFELDTNGDDQVDTILDYLMINPFPIENSGVFQNLTIDLNSVIPALQISSEEASNVMLKGLELIFQKPINPRGGWVDLSQSPRVYTWVIKDIAISGPTFNVASLSTFGYSTIGGSAIVDVPKQDMYNLYLRLLSYAPSTVQINLDGQLINLQVPATQSYSWYNFTLTSLGKGLHQLSIAPDPNILIDLFMARSAEDDGPNANDVISNITYQQVDPTSYRITSDYRDPYILVFLEAFDDSWLLQTSEGTIRPQEGNFFGNVYFLPNGTSGLLVLSYARQDMFALGFKISGIIWILSIIVLIVPIGILKKFSHLKLILKYRSPPHLER